MIRDSWLAEHGPRAAPGRRGASGSVPGKRTRRLGPLQTGPCVNRRIENKELNIRDTIMRWAPGEYEKSLLRLGFLKVLTTAGRGRRAVYLRTDRTIRYDS